MGYQQIKGIRVQPSNGPANRHFSSTPWETGYAFGGWIYNTQLDVGYSQGPTTISLDIALDTQTRGRNDTNRLNDDGAQAGSSFDINSGDLNISYQGGSSESYYKIHIGDNVYEPMYLSSYEIDGGSDTKVLRTKFVDYSSILDKIYVGLFKRQGYDKRYIHTLKSSPKIDAQCPDCSTTGAKFWHVTGTVTGSLEMASYSYNHGGSADKMLPPTANETYSEHFLRRQSSFPWFPGSSSDSSTIPAASTTPGMFNINGGTLILGHEEFNETLCGNLAPVSYNFSELIFALNRSNVKFSQVNLSNLVSSWMNHVSGKIDKNPNYRQSYNGTLREVLGQWCADFALDFYVTGRTVCFVDSSNGTLDFVKGLSGVMIPKGTNITGLDFNSDTRNAISSYNEKCDLSESYEQSIITFDATPRKVENKIKQVKNQCGFLAMHPLDFLSSNAGLYSDHETVYGQTFQSSYILNPIWPDPAGFLGMHNFNSATPGQQSIAGSPVGGAMTFTSIASAPSKHFWYTNRAFSLIDTCCALGKYSQHLRDIYVGGIISSALKEKYYQSLNVQGVIASSWHIPQLYNGFNSLSFTPLIYLDELNYSDFKQTFLKSKYDKKTSDNRQNYILNSINFEMVIGFYDGEGLKEIRAWEDHLAESMYKYGILTKGNLKGPPFLKEDHTDQPGFFDGLTGVKGITSTKIEATTTPPSEKYINFFKLPFKDIYQTSGEYSNPVFAHLNLTGISISELNNTWGTFQSDFDKKLKELSPYNECDNFKQSNMFSDGTDDEGFSPGEFNLADFAPQFFDITDDLFEELEDELRNAVGNNPGASDLLGKLIRIQKEKTDVSNAYSQFRCPKLVVLVIPNVSMEQSSSNYYHPALPALGAVLVSETNPHLQVYFDFYSDATNPVMAQKTQEFLDEKRKEALREFPKNICDTDLTANVCNIGTPARESLPPFTNPPDPLTDEVCETYSNSPIASAANCSCVSTYTGERYVGFETGYLINGPNCRSIGITIEVNNTPRIDSYLDSSDFSVGPQGHIRIIADDEDYPTFINNTTNVEIYYPIQSNPLGHNSAVIPTSPDGKYQYYSGILSHELTAQNRNPESIEAFGNYWSGTSNVAKIQQINNELNQEIAQQLRPSDMTFFKPHYDMGGNLLLNVASYHNLIASMSQNSNSSPTLSVSFEVVGDAAEIANFKNSLTPSKGLASLSYSLTQEGYKTKVSFSSKPKVSPKPEAILNKIRARL